MLQEQLLGTNQEWREYSPHAWQIWETTSLILSIWSQSLWQVGASIAEMSPLKGPCKRTDHAVAKREVGYTRTAYL